jgi:hypothetical protein
MRLPLLIALLLTVPVLPAAAQHSGHGSAAAVSAHGFRHGQPFRFRGSHFGFRGAPFANFFPGYWDWGWDGGWAWDGDWAWDGGAAAAAPSAPPPWRPRFAADTRPSAETTPQGVTIMRGPGSRHLPP